MHISTDIQKPLSVFPVHQQDAGIFSKKKYMLAKQPILLFSNIFHSTLLLNLVNCLYTICNIS